MNKHALWEPVPSFREVQQDSVTAVRLVFETPSTAALHAAVVGRERHNEILAEYYSQDAWENEGGAVAYAD